MTTTMYLSETLSYFKSVGESFLKLACCRGARKQAFWCVLIVSLAVVSAPWTLQATTYYVSPLGNDLHGQGTENSPYKTISRALGAVSAGDTIHLKPGIYEEMLSPTVSGTAGAPITIEGERGSQGEWLSVIDGTTEVNATWTEDLSIGRGVYKAQLNPAPYVVLVNGRYIPRIWNDEMNGGDGFMLLAYPPEQVIQTKGQTDVFFWDVVKAVYGNKEDYTYLRFADMEHPTSFDLRGGPAGAVLMLNNQSHWIIRDLHIRGGEKALCIKGVNATGNVVEHCRLSNAMRRVSIETGASYNVVRNCFITVDFFADCPTGAWAVSASGSGVPYDLALKEMFYREYKYHFGPNGTGDYGIFITGAGAGNEIVGNELLGGGQGIQLTNVTGLKVHHNLIRQFSSIGVCCVMNKVIDVEVHDNLIEDCNINIRIHHLDEPSQHAARSLYIYRNRLWNPEEVGSNFYFHFLDEIPEENYLHATVSLYHNSCAGAKYGVNVSAWAEENGGLPNTLIVNNIFSNETPFSGSVEFRAANGVLAGYDYNWCGGLGAPVSTLIKPVSPPPWIGTHNVESRDQYQWQRLILPDFLPRDDALASGLSLSEPFTIGTIVYDPLPGMNPGYYSGVAPDMGALQHTFAQDFSSSSVLGAYVDPLAPGDGNFNDISVEVDGGAVEINAGKLLFSRTSPSSGTNNGAGFTRVSPPLNKSPDVLTLSFSISVDTHGLYYFGTIGFLDIGDFQAVTDYTAPAATSSNQLIVRGGGTDQFRLEVNGIFTPRYPSGAEIDVFWVLNESEADRTYIGRDGELHLLRSGSSSLWVGESLIIDNRARATALTGTKLGGLRYRSTNPNVLEVTFDNFVCYPLLP